MHTADLNQVTWFCFSHPGGVNEDTMRAIANRAAERKQREREAGVYNSSQVERHREGADRRALHSDRDGGRDGDRGVDYSRRDPSRFMTNALVNLTCFFPCLFDLDESPSVCCVYALFHIRSLSSGGRHGGPAGEQRASGSRWRGQERQPSDKHVRASGDDGEWESTPHRSCTGYLSTPSRSRREVRIYVCASFSSFAQRRNLVVLRCC
jgi:hypothetical protein